MAKSAAEFRSILNRTGYSIEDRIYAAGMGLKVGAALELTEILALLPIVTPSIRADSIASKGRIFKRYLDDCGFVGMVVSA